MVSFVVGIPTYRRPEMLRALLHTLISQVDPVDGAICVVDNDAAGSAGPVVADFVSSDLEVHYEIESEPGVVAVRNRLLEMAISMTAECLIFIDDDEEACAGWFEAMKDMHHKHPLAVIAGRVVFQLPDECPEWIRAGGFFRRPSRMTGQVLSATGTGNTLVPLVLLHRLKVPRFNPAFALSGGEDSEFFSRLRKVGGEILWCDEAVVVERVESDRCSWEWLRARYHRSGFIQGRMALTVSPRWLIWCGGFARIIVGVGRWTSGLVRHGRIQTYGASTFYGGLGRMAAATGREVYEYGKR